MFTSVLCSLRPGFTKHLVFVASSFHTLLCRSDSHRVSLEIPGRGLHRLGFQEEKLAVCLGDSIYVEKVKALRV